jgi:hypothetical protein
MEDCKLATFLSSSSLLFLFFNSLINTFLLCPPFASNRPLRVFAVKFLRDFADLEKEVQSFVSVWAQEPYEGYNYIIHLI